MPGFRSFYFGLTTSRKYGILITGQKPKRELLNWGYLPDADGTYETLAQTNPFRYRGYYYDTETGLYYLNSRYYDASVCRFLSPDSAGILEASPMGLSDKNLYAYCDNNPVMRRDDGGMFWDTVFDVVSLVCSVVDVIKNPDDPWAWAGLAADVVSLAVPFATGGGTIVKAASKVDDVVDVARSVDKAADALDTATDIGKAVGKVDDAKDASKVFKNVIETCFVAGTLVKAESGSIPIEDIKVGDYVWATDPETNVTDLKKVVNTFVRESYFLIHIKVNGECITTTPTHPFWVPEKGWIDAADLRAGDYLQLLNGGPTVIESVNYEFLEVPITVYNFEVADFHTYYITDSAILVHNADYDAIQRLRIKEDQIFSSVRQSPAYRSDFTKISNGTKTVNIKNKALLDELNNYGIGWKKVYSDGYLNGSRASLHYFRDSAGRVYNVKYKSGWSVLRK